MVFYHQLWIVWSQKPEFLQVSLRFKQLCEACQDEHGKCSNMKTRGVMKIDSGIHAWWWRILRSGRQLCLIKWCMKRDKAWNCLSCSNKTSAFPMDFYDVYGLRHIREYSSIAHHILIWQQRCLHQNCWYCSASKPLAGWVQSQKVIYWVVAPRRLNCMVQGVHCEFPIATELFTPFRYLESFTSKNICQIYIPTPNPKAISHII